MPTLGIAAQKGGARTAAQANVPDVAAQAARSGGTGHKWLDFSEPSTWVLVYGAGAMVYLVGMYFGYGGTRGSVF